MVTLLIMMTMVLFFGVGTHNTTIVYAFIVGNRSHGVSASSSPFSKNGIKLMMTTASTSNERFKAICTFDEADFSGRTSWPYTSADLNRLDNSNDAKFYTSSRLVTHIDDNAIKSLQMFYQNEFETLAAASSERTIDVLDLCSSWISHFPLEEDVESDNRATFFRYGKVVGLGMNQEELDANLMLTERGVVRNLNINPDLKDLFHDETFNAVTMTVSIDYLIKPLEVIKEIHRMLKPGGSVLISFGDRCFATKAIAMWLQADAIDKITIVASYLHYSQYGDGDNDAKFKWSSIESFDLKEEELEVPGRPKFGDMLSNPALGLAWMNSASAVQKANNGDPLFVVKATKQI